MTYRLVLIEDDARESLRDSLQGLGDLDVVALPPPRDLDLADVLEENADLFLIDYELDTRQPDGSIANYRGTTLAARIREERPEFPIVLLTRSNLPIWTSEQRTVEAGGAFESVLYKEEDLRNAPDATYTKLVAIARGYRVLREANDRTPFALLDLLQTDEAGQARALDALPPDDGWKAVEAARWIRSVLLRYPGVVYGPTYAATALGISIDSFNQPAIRELLAPAEYLGPFAEELARWWRHALFDIANRLGATTETGIGLRDGFRAAASENVGLELEPARDEETGVAPADDVCYFLDIPVRIESSLPYQPDPRPSVMDEARISFKAIRETNWVDENHLDAASRAILPEIRRPHGR